MCWTPPGALPAAVPTQDAGADAGKGRACALDVPHAARPATAPAALSPRDQRYGARDPSTGVRVSATLGASPALDPAPLLGDELRARLAGCFAQHVAADAAITLAMHATLAVDARGRVTSAAIEPASNDGASAPDPRVTRCLQQALTRTAFSCSASGAATRAEVTYCLRRD
jgi:hypothetical protein